MSDSFTAFIAGCGVIIIFAGMMGWHNMRMQKLSDLDKRVTVIERLLGIQGKP